MKKCDFCSKPLTSPNSRAKFCDAKCRRRAHTARTGENGPVKVPKLTAVPSGVEVPASGIVAAVVEALELAGRTDSPAGQAAIVLAKRIAFGADSPTETSSGLAALSRELRATMADALTNAESLMDPLEKIRHERGKRRGA